MSAPQFQLPWHVAMKVFHIQLISELIRNKNYRPSEARKLLEECAEKFDPMVNELLVKVTTDFGKEDSLKAAEELVKKFNDELSECLKDRPNYVGHLQATLELYESSLVWDTNGNKFEDWIELMRKFFFHQGHKDVDTFYRLKDHAEALFDEDLRPYFDKHCGDESRDREMIMLRIVSLRETIAAVQAVN